MSEHFDPYHRWLGIPAKHQPADYYRLLALERFEDDPEVIVDAAERQMAHVRRYALGPHQDISQRILNELAAAKVCLLNPDKKAEYDRQLREQVAAQEQAASPVAPPSVSPLPRIVAATQGRSEVAGGGTKARGPTPPVRDPRRVNEARFPMKARPRLSPVTIIAGAVAGGILLGLVVVLVWSLFPGGDSTEVADAGGGKQAACGAGPGSPEGSRRKT